MRPIVATNGTPGICFVFKESGHTWIMDLDATFRIITNLALEDKKNQIQIR